MGLAVTSFHPKIAFLMLALAAIFPVAAVLHAQEPAAAAQTPPNPH